MIVKMNNKCENFYKYMGKFFGSRIIETETKDRIYDDISKDWYVYLKDDSAVAFVSVDKNVIKNIYSIKDSYLIELLDKVQEDIEVASSIVPSLYEEVYEKCKLTIHKPNNLKHFVLISKKAS